MLYGKRVLTAVTALSLLRGSQDSELYDLRLGAYESIRQHAGEGYVNAKIGFQGPVAELDVLLSGEPK